MKYVIIGNSAAAVGAVEGIRQADKTGEIVIISDEPHSTYSRPLISYFLQGKAKELSYRPADFYERNAVTALLGKKAVKIDAAAKAVALEGGDTVKYDKLLAATGSRAFVPPMDGLETVEKQFKFMSFSDALDLRKAIEETPAARVLIVGAGLIGLKCAEGIRGSVAEITVVDLAERILPNVLNATGAEIIRRRLEQNGIKFVLGESVKKFEGNKAALPSGEIEFDILVLAVGVRPNAEIVKDAGGTVKRGIVTDEYLRTTIPDVYAAGDCTESLDSAAGDAKILALLPNAYAQGEVAGLNMAGGEKKYERAIAQNAAGFFGLHMATAGVYDGESYEVADGENYKKLFYKDGVLKGYILIGEIKKAGVYTSLIRERTPLSGVDFELIKKSPTLAAFSPAVRAQKLGVAQ